MPPSSRPPSLRLLAETCGLSLAAASMALRGHARISRATIRRVRAAARRLGYHPNPLLSSVMEHVRSVRGSRAWLTVAFVWLEATARSTRTDPFQRQTFAAVLSRSRQVGIQIEPFHLAEPGMSPRRLRQILRARGIEGIIFSPSSNIPLVDLGLSWDGFAAVVMGNTPWKPEFHRAGHHHYLGMCRALHQMAVRGFRRPGLVLMSDLNERAWRAPEAAFLTHAPDRAAAAKRIYRYPRGSEPAGFSAWLRSARPDCLLFAFTEDFGERFAARTARAGLPCFGLDISDPGTLPGVAQDFEDIGANAVDLLMTQLLHNDRGVPHRPKIVLAEGRWHEAGPARGG